MNWIIIYQQNNIDLKTFSGQIDIKIKPQVEEKNSTKIHQEQFS